MDENSGAFILQQELLVSEYLSLGLFSRQTITGYYFLIYEFCLQKIRSMLIKFLEESISHSDCDPYLRTPKHSRLAIEVTFYLTHSYFAHTYQIYVSFCSQNHFCA